MNWVTKGAAQQGTFNGNPLSSAAGLAALTEVLTPEAYDYLGKLGTMLAEGCDRVIESSGIPAHTVDLGAKGCVSYRKEPLTSYRDFLETNAALYYASYPFMVNRGIFMTPGDEEQWTISVQHTEDDIQNTWTPSASSAPNSPASPAPARSTLRTGSPRSRSCSLPPGELPDDPWSGTDGSDAPVRRGHRSPLARDRGVRAEPDREPATARSLRDR